MGHLPAEWMTDIPVGSADPADPALSGGSRRGRGRRLVVLDVTMVFDERELVAANDEHAHPVDVAG